MESGCLDDDEAAAVVAGTLSEEARARLEAHADRCSNCRRLLSELARGTIPTVRGEVPLLARGLVVGRYVVEEVLGAGAMGVVYSAHDPELDRRVALKFVRPHHKSERAAARLVVEAQALAKVSHPNVVQVYDVGVADGRVFIALELVKGGTVRSWLTAEKRTPADVVALYRAAGEGLHAAHRAGVVHRDFKPDNLLIDDDGGRVRVTDFGLAAASFDRVSEPPAAESPEGSWRPRSLTESGMVLGTPAYMAPELRSGGRADARSDQYSFGVALVESLVAIQAGESAPRSVRRALDRALEVDPEKRFPSMAALVEALAWPSARSPRRWLAAAGAAVVLGLAGVAAARARSAPPPCTGGAARFDRILAPARLEKLAATPKGAGSDKLAAERAATAMKFRTLLDGYRRDWIAVYGDTCEATRVRGDQSEDVMDLKMGCLDARLAGAETLVSLLERGDPAIAERLAARDPLEPVASCADRAALLERIPRPKDPAARAKIQKVAEEVARIRALDGAGDYKRARADAAAAVAEARAVGYGPVLADALVILATAELHDADAGAAERDTTDAALVGEASHHDRAVALARISLVRIVGSVRERAAEGRRLAEEAAAAIARLGGDADLELALVGARGDLADADNKPEEARRYLEEAVELAKKAHGEGSLPVGRAENDLGAFLMGQPDGAASLPHLDRAYEIEAQLGAHHPALLLVRYNRGIVLLNVGRIAEAKALARGLVELNEEAVGPDHFNTAKALQLYAQVLLYEPATRSEAAPSAKRALAILEKILDPDTTELAIARSGAGEMLLLSGAYAEAEAALAKAVVILEKRGESQGLIQSLELHGEALLGLGREDEAAAELDRALSMSKEKGFEPRPLGTNEIALARALVKKDPKRAHALAVSAEANLLASTFPDDERLEAARAWLRDHPR